MSEDNLGPLDALIQEKLDADTEFIATLEGMSDEEKETALAQKRVEIGNLSFQELQEKANKDAELAKNYKTRAEKAEESAKGKKDETPPTNRPTEDNDLSGKDYAYLYANVHEDDVDEVVNYAKFKKLDIREALKDPVMVGILNTNKEHRKTAAATNTSGGKSGNKQISDDELVRQASEGKSPEPGTPEAERLFWARRGGKPGER